MIPYAEKNYSKVGNTCLSSYFVNSHVCGNFCKRKDHWQETLVN